MSGQWARVFKGLQLVASTGASTAVKSFVSSPVLTRHVPELVQAAKASAARGADALRERDLRHSSFGGDPRESVETTGGVPRAVGASEDDGRGNDRGDASASSAPPTSQRAAAGPQHAANATVRIEEARSIPNVDDTSENDTERTDDSVVKQSAHHPPAEDDERPPRHLPEGSAVPSTRVSRALGFASLGAGLAAGTAAELARRVWSTSPSSGPAVLSSDANARRLAGSLRRMRGAAMKLGQMLSIQDESIAPPALTRALESVREGAESMPEGQLLAQIDGQWGDGWRDRIDLEDRPFAAASIGQGSRQDPVPRRRGLDRVGPVEPVHAGEGDRPRPPGPFPGQRHTGRSGRAQGRVRLRARARESKALPRPRRLGRGPRRGPVRGAPRRGRAEHGPDPGDGVRQGGTVDRVMDMDQDERNRIGRAVMRLTMLELFVWRFMQTDPNWGNFLYDVRTRTTYLIDFGAAREYDEDFVRGYLNIVVANANRDEKALIDESIRMGFLTGDESNVMMEAHKMSGFCLGEPFQSYEPYDFKSSRITSRISEHGAVFLKHRLTPPPEEVYTLHRKLAGAYNLCIKIGAKISCRDLLDEMVEYNKT
ncbi:hypothetical protein THAOC_36873 [Thalassiosira oceanica]|uniref:ABC1 atypical kinase-like domain-containing protein n=1 Tax=Thalassiosira oceanica TaxID=159749 RepID=K0R154_THAOC|nr:hypothetical protein THAOC_36873 [Thalassiosira oceanica]|eukprot:EJK44579.1 hypothetical protein THAOC_36873 [Thalassiosira oceanica]